MASQYKYLREVLNFSERLSYKKKQAYDWRWAEEKVKALDAHYPDHYDWDRIMRFRENYDLLNGNGEKLMHHHYNNVPDHLHEEDIRPAHERVNHFDILSPMLYGLYGEQQGRPLQWRVVDSSEYTQNLMRYQRVKFLQDYIKENYVGAIQARATQDWMIQNQVTDLLQLTPEEQQQFQSDIQARVQNETPAEFDKFLRRGFKSPREVQASRLLGYLERELDLKFVTDEGYKHALVTGEEVYYVGIRHGKPVVEWVNPMEFISVGSPENTFVDEDQWARRVKWLSPSDIWDRHAASLTSRSDLKKLDAIFERATGNHDKNGPAVEPQLMNVIANISIDDEKLLQDIDIRTKKGQEQYYKLLSRNIHYERLEETIREAHFVWKSLRKVKDIKRVSKEGVIKRFYVDESYTFDKAKGDIEETILWIPEVYQTTMIGEIDPVFVDKGPLPYQHRSLRNPHKCYLPYIGALYNKHAGNSENVAPIDRAKKWQHKYNVQMARIHEMESTDIGKVLLTTLAAKPEGWSWGKFIEVIRYAKIAPIDTKKEGITQFDAQFFKSIDLSNMYDILPRLNYLSHIRDMAALSLAFNSARLGDPSPFTTVANNQQNLLRAVNQSKHVSMIHDKILERVLNRLYDTSRVAYKDEDLYARFILDDLSIQELELDNEMLKSSEIGVHIVTSGEEFANVQMAKELLLPLIQTGNLGAPESVRLLWAKSKAELMNFAEEAELKAQMKAAQAMDMQSLSIQQEQELKKELITLTEELKRITEREKSESKERMAALNSMLLARAQDIDENQIPDSLQRTRAKLKLEEEVEKRKLSQKDFELKLKEAELALKERDSKRKHSNKK